MNIQISVLLWTIICFCLLMLILNNLLFKPLLAVMDKRQERIRQAKEKQSINEASYARAIAEMEQAREDDKKRQAQIMAQTVEEAHRQAEAQIAEARQEGIRQLETYGEELRREHDDMKAKLDAGADALAEVFANRVTS